MNKIICFGEILVDFTAKGNHASLMDASHFEKFSGGAPANTATALGRLGADVTMLGSVGADDFGGYLINELGAHGVDTSHIQTLKNRPTAVVFVALDHERVPRFHSFGQGVAYNYFRTGKKSLALISKSKIFHFTSIAFIEDPYRHEAMKALHAARESGLLISFDPNIRLHLFKSGTKAKKVIKGILPFCQILKFGLEEFLFLFKGTKTGVACERLARMGAKLILITEGAEGVTYYFKGVLLRVKAFSVEALDTTGAGDAFGAGILSKIAAFKDVNEISPNEMRKIVRFASAVAAISTTQMGATTAIPNQGQVKRFMAAHED